MFCFTQACAIRPEPTISGKIGSIIPESFRALTRWPKSPRTLGTRLGCGRRLEQRSLFTYSSAQRTQKEKQPPLAGSIWLGNITHSVTISVHGRHIFSLWYFTYLSFSSGVYAYTEASEPQQRNDRARLISAMIQPGKVCLEFWYHMYGSSMGWLRVLSKSPHRRERRLWYKYGNQLNEWHRETLSIFSYVKYQVRFYCVLCIRGIEYGDREGGDKP